jgi:hypothetical protein
MSGFPVSGVRRSTSDAEPASGVVPEGPPRTLPKSTGMRQAAPRWAGRVPVILVVGIAAYAAVRGVSWAMDWDRVALLITNADHAIYMAQAERILAGGPFYPPDQLGGPFGAERLPELYPPTTVIGLLLPAALLPAFLWWLVPLAVTTAVVVAHRPSPWGWVAILSLLVLYPHTWTIIAAGNPMLWATMGIALGTRYGWPALLALVVARSGHRGRVGPVNPAALARLPDRAPQLRRRRAAVVGVPADGPHPGRVRCRCGTSQSAARRPPRSGRGPRRSSGRR